MDETVIAKPLRALGIAVSALVFVGEPAAAQAPYPGAGARNPVCTRLEAQLAAIDRGGYDPARADQIKRLEETVSRQQFEVDRMASQARRYGCEGRGFFSLFGGQPQQCGNINTQLQQLRGNLDSTLGELQRLQGNSADREGQRRTVLASLGQYDCGPQYRAYANRGFFEQLFGPGPGSIGGGGPEVTTGNTFRTLCVRTCDGYYFPISYSTQPSRFAEDEKTCQAMCPAAEVVLFTHRNPGEDVNQAVSISGRNYTDLPTAFAYRKTFNPSCSCRAAGQTWADALKHLDDQTVERGDIIVNEERARALSQPQVDAQGRPIRKTKGKATPAAAPAESAVSASENSAPEGTAPKRKVRTVGPTFLPEH
jgi:Protein of unknown function (DUF2865)